MPATVAKPVFLARDGQIWLGDDPQSLALIALNTASLLPKGKIVACDQAPAPQPPSIRLFITVANDDSHDVFTALIPDLPQVLENRAVSFRLFKRVLSSATPISKISAIHDGVFASARDGTLYYGDASGPRPTVHMLVGATGASGPMADIVAAKDGIATFLSNLLDALPKMVAAVEQRVGQELLNAFGADIKAQQQKLGDVFNKPLSSLIQQSPQATPNNAAAALSASPGEPADHAVRRLFVSKLELGRILNPFSEQPASADIPAAAPAAAAADGSDPMDALGKLFQPLSLMLDPKKTQSLLSTGVEDLLGAISGPKSISDVLNDMFNIFKIDDTMNALNSILSGGQCSKLVGQLPLKDYLSKPVDNAFFNALYDHYFPGKQFTTLDFAAFMGALFGYVAFAAQGKSDDFHSVFSDQQSLNELTSCPEKLVQAISGSSAPPPAPMLASAAASTPRPAASGGAKAERVALMAVRAPAPLAEDAPPAEWRVAVACTFSALMTLVVGGAGAISFGTGLLASPMTGGVAAGVFQCLGGIIQNGDTRDAKWDLLGGFVGGFTGALLSTLVGNRLFASWAQKGDTPSARIQKLKLIMIGFTLTLGGGGGAIVSSLLKNYAKSQKLVFNDPIALTTGAIGGFGGGAMGCGLHFMGALSGTSCLPVMLSQADAAAIARDVVLPPPPPLDNSAPLPAPIAGVVQALPNVTMGVYRIGYNYAQVEPPSGQSIAFVTYGEFTSMDGPAAPWRYINQRQKLFWLESGATNMTPPPPNRRADLVIGVHGIGRHVFLALMHAPLPTAPNVAVDFSRPMYKDDFAGLLAADAWITGFLTGIRNNGQNRLPIIKLAVCFSALPLGCCSLSQELATRLNATVYGGRPPVYPWLDATARPRVPGWGGWIKYDP